jgi:hypothetical protein
VRFDGYAGTIREVPFPVVAEGLRRALGGALTGGQPRRRYRDVADVQVGGRTAVWVAVDPGNQTIYFEGKGETSPDLAAAVREAWPGHSVARADVCEDYDDPEAFERLVGLVRHHKGDRVYGGFAKLPDEGHGHGRTWEAGARDRYYIRVYEAGKMRERLHFERPNWVRAELEARPHYSADKQMASRLTPLAFWGMAAWTSRVGAALTQLDVPRYEPPSRAYSHDRTTVYIGRTFERHFREMLEDLGDWECVGRELMKHWRGPGRRALGEDAAGDGSADGE